MAEPRRTRARLTLVMIAVVFLLPLVAAYLWRPSGEPGNYGTLIQPPRPLQGFEMTGLDGSAAGLNALKGKWTLLYVGGERCLEQCRRNLYNIERVRLTQGEDMQRMQSLYLAPASMKVRVIQDRLVKYEGVQGYRISRAELEDMAPGFDWSGREADERARIYVIDPLGNLMMYYAGDADPSRMKQDLERLLKASQIG